jgi:hypothetical protein
MRLRRTEPARGQRYAMTTAALFGHMLTAFQNTTASRTTGGPGVPSRREATLGFNLSCRLTGQFRVLEEGRSSSPLTRFERQVLGT